MPYYFWDIFHCYQFWFNSIRQALPSQQYPQSPNLYGSALMKKWKHLA